MEKASLHELYAKLYKSYGPQHWWPADSPLEVIVGAILTQSTNWRNVEQAIANLKGCRALSLSELHKMPVEQLSNLIRPAGYFRQKARKLKAFVAHLDVHHSSDLQKMLAQPTEKLRAELLEIWGIGPETADSILLYAGKKPIFIVDAYTRRVCARLGLDTSEASYEELQKFFMRQLPSDVKLLNEYHVLIVYHAQKMCRPKPLCSKCVLAMNCVHAPERRDCNC